MPRLLLVDDNPSIHKIAETLLASTDVDLVCAESGATALEFITRGPAFDVALVDISMAGMDGWQLLERLRGMEATARLPIALMAGVLDQVDPERLSLAPIQGFIKKPVELRDLGEKVKVLLATPVPAPPAPAPAPGPDTTLPRLRLSDYPEFREAAPALPGADDLILLTPEDLFPGDFQEEMPGIEASGASEVFEPTEAAAAPAEAPAAQGTPAQEPALPALAADEDVILLEEFDLDSLRDLTPPAMKPLGTLDEDELGDLTPPTGYILPVLPEESMTRDGIEILGEHPGAMTTGRMPPEPEPLEAAESFLVSGHDLPDLDPEATASEAAEEVLEAPYSDASAFDWTDDSDSLLLAPALDAAPEPIGFELAAPRTDEIPAEGPASRLELDTMIDLAVDEALPSLEAEAFQTEPPREEPAAEMPAVEMPAAEMPAAEVPAAEVPAAPLPATGPAPTVITARVPPMPGMEPLFTAADLASALLSDPVLLDRLAQAIASRLSDRTLREVAWEVMPELADRLNRL